MVFARCAFASWTVFAFARVACLAPSERLNATKHAEIAVMLLP
jgi:hypothetical protein